MKKHAIKLIAIDILAMFAVTFFFMVVYPDKVAVLTPAGVVSNICLSAAVLIAVRSLFGMYRYIWRYVKSREYIILMLVDMAACIAFYFLDRLLPEIGFRITLIRSGTMFAVNLLVTLGLRFLYQYLYEARSQTSRFAALVRRSTALITGIKIESESSGHRICIAIVGAGRVGVGLAEDLTDNHAALYRPACFIDTDREKAGRIVVGLPVLLEEDATQAKLDTFEVQEVVIALPDVNEEIKRSLYERYSAMGYKVKTFDYPTARNTDSKRTLRDFDVEDLLFRRQQNVLSDEVRQYYQEKTVLISGGGGSIGSELARQLVPARPRKIVILDIYENNAYDIQQELRISSPEQCLEVEICSITDPDALQAVFRKHAPDIVLHAAAHKHVPLMETNCREAIRNNVFGTCNILEAAEASGVSKFIMISTDKAVNPTNVMGATKRVCEMIVLAHQGHMICSATRFGNVLGSNGSVIPLFRRQIQSGGPITITDKRIIRYFMTVQEATQLVLTSGAMADQHELYVLDMGKPVKILDLARSMIRLSGVTGIEIVETGLRPGEKLYEETLIKSEEMDKTANEKIFIERDKALSPGQVDAMLKHLQKAVATNDEEACRQALRKAVPTYKSPEDVNGKVDATAS